MKNIKATSLVEVVIASLILAVVFAGLVAGFVSVRKYIARAKKRLVSTNYTREIFNQTTGNFSGYDWGNNNFLTIPVVYLPLNIDGSNYNAGLSLSNPTGANYGQVNANVTFPVD
jgi:hypothetical protein